MADGKSTSIISDVAEFQPTAAEKREHYRQSLMNKHHANRGGKYQPFSIEHLPYERSRLSKLMTAEDRFLRHQWLKDQELHPSEPLKLEELWPRNIIRRAYMVPWNFVEKILEPQIGTRWAVRIRVAVPRLMMGALAGYWFYYHIKYNSRDWEKQGGWTWFRNKPTQFSDEVGFDPYKYDIEPQEFYHQNFNNRKALLDLKTSRSDYR